MISYERSIMEQIPGSTPKEKFETLTKMKEALEFWLHTFEGHSEEIHCSYGDNRYFKPYNQIIRTKEALNKSL